MHICMHIHIYPYSVIWILTVETDPIKQPWFAFQRDLIYVGTKHRDTLCLKLPFQRWPWHLEWSLRNQCHLELNPNQMTEPLLLYGWISRMSNYLLFFFAKHVLTLSFPQPPNLPLKRSEVVPRCPTFLLLHFTTAKIDPYWLHWWTTEGNIGWVPAY